MGPNSVFFSLSLLVLAAIPSVSSAHIDSKRRAPPQPPARVKLNARQEPAPGPPEVVSLENFPNLDCATSYCINYNYVYQCDLKKVACSDPQRNNCQGYDKACYCSQATSLYCAWGCPWFEWFKIEDWYLDVCGEAKVNFDALPQCARECIIDRINDGGCVNHSRNCVCLKNTLYDCPDACNDGDRALIRSWWGEQCVLTPEEVDYAGIVGSATATAESQTQLPSGASEVSRATGISDPGQYKEPTRKLKWYEIYGLVIVLVTIVMVSLVYFFIWKAEFKYIRNERKKPAQNGKEAANRSSTEKGPISSPSAEKIATPRVSGEKK